MGNADRRKGAGRWPGAMLALACLAATGFADELVVAGPDALNNAVSRAAPGDTIRLAAGTFEGPIRIDRPLTLLGRAGSVIDAGGSGRVITVDAPDVVIRDITVRNSGSDLSVEDSGVFVTKQGDRALIAGNRIEHSLIGVYLKGPDHAIVRNNVIIGRDDLRMNERGNGVHLWNTPGSIVEGNTIRFGRDGIFVTSSTDNIFRKNTISDLRYAVHYMYTNRSEISGNESTGNHAAYALMFSEYLKVDGNRSTGDRDRGLFFNYANFSKISGNVVRGGSEKCVFIYNSNYNEFRGNEFRDCAIGIHFTAGSEQNTFSENLIAGNRMQVKYVGTRYLEWSHEGRGNYWGDHTAFDLDADDIGDRPYQPNTLVDKIFWRYPQAKILANSPVFDVLRWAQSRFPSLHPGGVIDSAPLMSPPKIASITDH